MLDQLQLCVQLKLDILSPVQIQLKKSTVPIGTNSKIEKFVKRNLKNIYDETKIKYCENKEEAILDADICVIFTEWEDIKDLNPKLFEKLMKKPIILDGRNCFEIENIRNYNVIYESIGRPAIDNIKTEDITE